MCGRYAASANPDELVEEFEVDDDRTPRPRAATSRARSHHRRARRTTTSRPPSRRPSSSTGCRASDRERAGEPAPERQLRLLTWGLVPAGPRTCKVGTRMINARAESLFEKPGFAKAAASRRCLVPAHGWYEWQKSPVATDAKGKPRKQPFFMTGPTADVVAFAGLYEFWRDREIHDRDDPEAWLTTFTVITTEAEPGLDRIHDRMPLVLERGRWATWLDPDVHGPGEVGRLLDLLAAGPLRGPPGVDGRVSPTATTGPSCVEPLPVTTSSTGWSTRSPARCSGRTRRDQPPQSGTSRRRWARREPRSGGHRSARRHRRAEPRRRAAASTVATCSQYVDGLVEARWAVALVEQPWGVAGRRNPPRPDPAGPGLAAGARGAATGRGAAPRPASSSAGKSNGARVACRTAHAAGRAGVLCLAVPAAPARASPRSRGLRAAGGAVRRPCPARRAGRERPVRHT